MRFRFLLVSIVLSAHLLWWPQVAHENSGKSGTPTSQPHSDAKPVPPTRVVIEEPVPTIRTQPVSDSHEGQPKEKPWKRFFTPEWVIVYITAAYVFIAWLTMGAIKRQADLLKEQVKDGGDANTGNAETAAQTLRSIEAQAKLMEDSVTVAKLQVQTTNLGVQVAMRSAESTLIAANAARDNASATLLSAKAVMVSERPWLLVSIVKHEYEHILSPDIYTIQARNAGRTPAELVAGHCVCRTHEVLFTGPSEGISDPFFLPMQNLIVNQDSFPIRTIDPESMLTQEDRDGFGLEPSLFLYGWISYWDTFTDRSAPGAEPSMTRWIFRYDAAQKRFFRVAGNYTKNT